MDYNVSRSNVKEYCESAGSNYAPLHEILLCLNEDLTQSLDMF